MLKFSESVSFDRRLAVFDIQGSRAHAAMLAHVGLISAAERDAIQAGLDELRREIEAGGFAWDSGLEDVHMNIEQALTKRVPAAAKLHTARSRNDQVAMDMRLFFKQACAVLQEKICGAGRALLAAAEANRDVLIPGLHPSPAGAAGAAGASSSGLARDARSATASGWPTVADHANWCPLGSGAIAGTTLPIDREFTARALGFRRRARAAAGDAELHGCRGRPGRLHRVRRGLRARRRASLAHRRGSHALVRARSSGLSRCPTRFCTGSSLMPQKKNPDSCELLRGKSARLQGNLQTLLTLVKGLPLTYNRDLQEDKPPVFDSLDQTALCLDVLAGRGGGPEGERGALRGRRGRSRAAGDGSGGLSGAQGRAVPRGASRRGRGGPPGRGELGPPSTR